MSDPATSAQIDRSYLWSLFGRFVSYDTSVVVGQTSVDPNDPRIARFAADVAAPAFEELGARVRIDALNNVIGEFGPLQGTEVAFVSYPVLHHANLMAEPLRARVISGADSTNLWFGAGASQGKAGMAAVCAAARALVEKELDLSGRVVLAMCSEGGSSHRSSEKLYRSLVPHPAGAVLTVGTDNQITLGNRGRVDILVRIAGKSTHSSVPERGVNPITQVPEVLDRIAHLQYDRTSHPQLGRRALTIYSLSCGPIAPHTTPTECRLRIDRRLLPGDSPELVVDEMRDLLLDLPVDVSMGPLMFPVLTSSEVPVIASLIGSARRATVGTIQLSYPAWTFDAGYPASIGIPSIMFGPSTADISGAEVMSDDYVVETTVLEAAAIYASMMSQPLDQGQY